MKRELRWVSCSKEASLAAARHRHLIVKGFLTTVCGATASHVEVWRGNTVKPPCPACAKVSPTALALGRIERTFTT